MYHFIANVEYYLGQENVIIKKKKKTLQTSMEVEDFEKRWSTLKMLTWLT